MIHPVAPDVVPQLRAAGMTFGIVPGTATRMPMMNLREGSPFADPEVRQSMSVANDKQAISDLIHGRLAVPLHRVPGVGQEGHVEGCAPVGHDPEAARAVLGRATKPLKTHVRQQWQLAAEVVAERLRGYGTCVITVVPGNASCTRTDEAGTFDLLSDGAGDGSGDLTGACRGNPFECVRLLTSRVRTGFCGPDLDGRIADIRSGTDGDARRAPRRGGQSRERRRRRAPRPQRGRTRCPDTSCIARAGRSSSCLASGASSSSCSG
jgi:ABC-type transport system substrate-binding protein